MTTEMYPASGRAELAQYLYDSGLLFVVNSVLHHYGLALAVGVDEETRSVVDGLALNYTTDPNGFWFDEEQISHARTKMREAGLVGAGPVVQPDRECTTSELVERTIEALTEGPKKILLGVPSVIFGHGLLNEIADCLPIEQVARLSNVGSLKLLDGSEVWIASTPATCRGRKVDHFWYHRYCDEKVIQAGIPCEAPRA